MHKPIALAAALFATIAFAEAQTPPAPASAAPNVVVEETTGIAFDDMRTALEMAIANRGLNVTNTLHISEMMERTSADTGLPILYGKAESLEFCSIPLSHQMSSAHPANLAICPLTIGFYTLPDAPDTVYVAYRRPFLLGDDGAATQAVLDLLQGIVDEAKAF